MFLRYDMQKRDGVTLIDLLVSIAIISMLFVAIYIVYFTLVFSVNNIDLRGAAVAIAKQEIETIRNMPYESVGTVGGVPAGIIPQSQTQSFGSYTFTVQTTVRNIDDPFDGTLGGTPNDTAPADYKFVAVTMSCPTCPSFVPFGVTTTVAPPHLESASKNGSIFIYALNANGVGIPGATMHITNASVTPSIDLTDTTNASGVLQIVDVPTSTNNYHITAAKSGFSSDQTYHPGTPPNPNPSKPDITVAQQTVSSATFAIDKVSTVNVSTTDVFCLGVANQKFTIQGTKIIGTSPNVIKFTATSTTNASGTASLANIEWDTYSLSLNDALHDVLGTIPLTPFTLNPSSTLNFRFVVVPVADPALMVSVLDAAGGAGLTNATVTISRTGFAQSLTTGHTWISQTDWSGGNYSQKDAGLDVSSSPGKITLTLNASSTYTTSTISTLTSKTFDLGGASSTLYALSWNPVSQPPSTGADSLKIQLAVSNDNATWNFTGPDGTSNSYFTASGNALPASLSGNRYLRYRVFMSTADANTTPWLDDISVEVSSVCVPPAQVLFQNLAQNSYIVDVQESGYAEATTSVAVGVGYKSSTISMMHL